MRQRILPLRNLVVLLLFAIATFVSLIHYRIRLDRDLRERAHTLLNESALDHAGSLNSWINTQFTVLGALSDYIGRLEEPPAVKSQLDLMNSVMSTGDFHAVGLSSASGYTLLNNGKRLWLGNTGYFRRSLSGGQVVAYIENTTFANYPALILSLPVEQNGQPVGVLFGVYRMELIAKLLVSASFRGEGYLMLIDAGGSILARQDLEHSPIERNNLFDHLADVLPEGELEAFRGQLRRQGSAMLTYPSGNELAYGVLQPVGINGWQLFVTVPAEPVEREYAFIYQGATQLTTLLATAFVGLILSVLWQDNRIQRILRQEKEQLRQSEERYRLVEELTDTVMFEIDLLQRELVLNHNFKNVYGHDLKKISIDRAADPNGYIYPQDHEDFKQLCEAILAGRQASLSADIRILDTQGNPIWSRIDAIVLTDSSGTAMRAVGKIHNIDRQMEQIRQLRSMAEQDPLTHLLNRKSFKAEVDGFLAAGHASGLHAFLMIDIDDFKLVNDTYGHFEGDRVLRLIAEIMQVSFRASDILGRLGGDEFTALMKSAGSLEFVEQKVSELCRRVGALTNEQGVPYGISCSIGVALCLRAGISFDELYQNADAALYEAKRQGKNRWVFSDASAEQPAQ